MKKITFIAALLMSAASFAQLASTSFENPAVIAGQYTDTGDANVAHDLVNNPDEPVVDFVSTGDELGFNARYTPYDTPDVGLTDGDFVGVTNFQPTGDIMYTDGVQGYQISDADGNFILEFDIVDLATTTSPFLSIDYFISGDPDPAMSSYEGDGTTNTSDSDRLRIYVKDLTNNTEIDILDTTGSDIDDLGIEGDWVTGVANLLPNTMVQLVIEARMNASAEAFFFDNVIIDGILNTNNVQENQFSLFPNPATNYINVTSKNAGEIAVAIYDVLGKRVLNTTATNRVNITSLNAGVYIVKISQNGLETTKKLIVQ